MKTIKDIKSNIEDKKRELEMFDPKSEKAKYNKAKKGLAFLRLVKQYLETEPSEDFLKSELSRLHVRIDRFNELHKLTPRKIVGVAAKEMGITIAREQCKTIQFIIGA